MILYIYINGRILYEKKYEKNNICINGNCSYSCLHGQLYFMHIQEGLMQMEDIEIIITRVA